jgi:hypothetical protein
MALPATVPVTVSTPPPTVPAFELTQAYIDEVTAYGVAHPGKYAFNTDGFIITIGEGDAIAPGDWAVQIGPDPYDLTFYPPSYIEVV